MKRIIFLLEFLLAFSVFIGCTSNTSTSKIQKQTIDENASRLSSDMESEDDDYAPQYTQIWRSKDKNISFRFASKYGFRESVNCNITGDFYGINIEIDNTWESKGKYDGEMYFSTDGSKGKLYELFYGEYKLSKNKNSLILIIQEVYKNKVDKHDLKKGDKIVFEKISGLNAQTHKNEENKADKDFTYTYNSDTKVLTFYGKGIIQEGVEDKADNGWTKIKDPKHIVISSGITGIGDFAFFAEDKDERIGGDIQSKNYFSKIEDVKMPDTITEIGETAFFGCKSLKSIKLPSKIKIINDSTFGLCNSLSSVTMGDYIEKIDTSAFYNCKKLKTVKMPNKLRVIGYKSFENCTELSNIEIPGSTNSIASYAFIGCGKLKDITVPKNVKKIGMRAFGYITDKRKVKDFTIKGYKGTATEKYAKKNGFKFVALNK